MNEPVPQAAPVPPEAPAPSPAVRAATGTARGIGWLGLWLPGALLALLIAGAVALWWWADTPGSLARTLQWAQSYTQDRAEDTGALSTRGVEGSLRGGGRIGHLRWSRDGLAVDAYDVQLRLGPQTWLDALRGRGLHIEQLAIRQLVVNDRREPSPSEPLESFTLPLEITLPFAIEEVVIEQEEPVALRQLAGLYRYGPADAAGISGVAQAHRLQLDSLQVAGGRYRGQLALGAQSPMPLQLALQGELPASVPQGQTLTLQASADASGTLGGRSATLDVSARVEPLPEPQAGASTPAASTPTLSGSARVMPWAPQPLVSANATAHRLDLATLWPTAPVTLLSGTVQAEPDGEAWRAQVDLSNDASGPADRQRVPVQRLRAALEQSGARWSLTDIDAQVGGGQLQGNAQLELVTTTLAVTPAASGPGGTATTTLTTTTSLGAWQGDLRLRGVNPARLWSALAPAALDGSLEARTVDGSSGQEAFDLEVRVQPSGRQPSAGQLAGLRLRELRLQGRWQPAAGDPTQGVLDLRRADLFMADARLQAQGRVDTSARLFAGQFSAQVPGAQAQWKGLLAHHTGDGDASVQLDDAARVLAWLRSLQAMPVLGPPVKALLDQQAGLAAQGNARLTAQWQGGLGALGYPPPVTGATASVPYPRVQLALDVPRLVVQPAQSTGTATAPISASDLRLRASGRLDDLQLQAQGSVAQAPWSGFVDTQGRLQSGDAAAPLARGQVNLNSLQLRLTDASRSDRITEWALQSSQALALMWQGGPPAAASAFQLQVEPGQLLVQPGVRNAAGQRVAAPELGSGPLTVAWESLVWRPDTFQTRGRLSGLPMAWIDVLGRGEGARAGPLTQAGLSGNLVFDGSWDILLPADASTPLRLSAQLQRSSGDLTVQTDGGAGDAAVPPVIRGVQVAPVSTQRLQAGIRTAAISLSAQGNRVQASLRWDSERLGQASADLGTQLNLRGPAGEATDNPIDRWWPASAPLQGTARARLPQVGVWSALAPPGWRMRGTLAADATISGTRGAPQWNGNLQADQLALRSVVDGFAFSNGELRATLSGERIIIQRFTLQGPRGTEPGGTLEATGSAEWRAVPGSALRQPFIDLQATATRLRVSNRADRRVTLSGQVNAQLAGPRLVVRGQLNVDSALIVLPDETKPTLGTDVVVRGTRELEDPDAVPVQPDVLVDVNLGNQFEVRGRGLQTRLGGQLSVRSTPGSSIPRVLGEVRTISGTYQAYGQQLSIETGVLRFAGPYDNPTLDILAVRPQQGNVTQRVGVQITGTAQLPRVRLFSDPELPDSEKLAWLVLGRPATGAGAEAAVLQQAAMALLAGNGGGLDGGLAGIFGLDELGFRAPASNADGSSTSAALTLGKRISNDLYVSYERSLAGAMGTVSVFYDVSRRLTLRARAGEENAIDLIFTLRYD
ncbi:MAG: translocation/assembly module TamB domain-containing protein [Parvibaculum sp.]|uniref:translocation/assembly module TamB domain-containing protein n=1 Tax=Parvibaculum sp. TaxID=2024848 RepID=UPI002731D5F3|nr:translocation/assembly module TamB domain-containing protein [Parvibaculum sp.]MDP2149259.1 translocation/assembly module TamB domain-containing protein [Parvibaculum sp.]